MSDPAGRRPFVEVRGQGPDLVMLHGWALHGGMWGPWLDRLAERARLHVVDLPGHGRSGGSLAAGSTLKELTAGVEPLVPPGAALLGWSLGGLVALEIARAGRVAVDRLVLVTTTPCFLMRHDWSHGMRKDVLDGFAAGLQVNFRRTVANFLALQTWGDERGAEALRMLRESFDSHGEADPAALRTGLEILRDTDLRHELSRIVAPTLVLAGEHDRITPPGAGRELAAALRGARYVEIPRAGHAPFLSHPDSVLDEVVRFLGLAATSGPAEPRAAALGIAIEPAAAGSRWARGPQEPPDPHRLDLTRVRRSFAGAARTYDAAAVLQARVRDELLDRLDLLTLRPASVLDLGCGTGQGAAALSGRYREGRVTALDLATGMLHEAARRRSWRRRFDLVAADAGALPFADRVFDMVFSNLMLQWCIDLDRVLRECRRVLRPGGVLHLATLGPDTLVELRRAWREADPSHAHVSRFVDMHDLGEALVRAGFAEPVLDVERHVVAYDDARTLMRELKAIGAHNATAGRARGLTGKATWGRMLAAYESRRRDGRLQATYEVVYAQAWVPERPVAGRSGRAGQEFLFPMSGLRVRR